MRRNAVNVLCYLLVCILVGVTDSCGAGDSRLPTVLTYPARPLPVKFIAATAMTGRFFKPKQERLDIVRSIAQRSKEQGINAVNLILDWNDLESRHGTIDYDLLDRMITEIKSRNLFCILRIYVNAESNWRAWPAWLSPSQMYVSKGGTVKNILPWDSKYQTSFALFQQNLAAHFILTQIQPDAYQIAVGGSYGEQVLAGYDWQAAGLDWSSFLTMLFNAEKKHVDMYLRTLGSISKDHILMVNSVSSRDIAREDTLANYARNKGVTWFESNAGACCLIGRSFGPDNMRMLGRFKGGGARIFLEDESGPWECLQVSQDSSLSHRVELMRQLQSIYGFTFDAVSIRGDISGDLNDTAGISALKHLLGL